VKGQPPDSEGEFSSLGREKKGRERTGLLFYPMRIYPPQGKKESPEKQGGERVRDSWATLHP